MNAKRSLLGVAAATASLVIASMAFGQDYPGAVWNPADVNNYGVAARSAPDIRWIVIHTTEDAPGSDCSVSQNWFKNPNQNGNGTVGVSAHYVICRDGTVVQMVRDKDIAYHAGNLAYNNQSIGIEHERHDTSNWTEAQFQASAELTRWLVSRYNIQGIFPSGIAPANPSNGSGIIGHDQVPDPNDPNIGGGISHKIDPRFWDWPHYQELFIISSFLLTAERAIQVTFPTRESYQYQVFSSTNFTDWLPATERLTACSSNETVTFKMTNGHSVFYRGQEFPPDLTRRIVGLSNIFLDTASTSSASNRMTIHGMRVESRDYNLNDYVIATYELDLCKQLFSIRQLEVITNVGPTCGTDPLFFLDDATNTIRVLNGVTVLNPDTGETLISTGQTLFVDLTNAQVFSMVTVTTPELRVIANDPLGAEVFSRITAGGGFGYFHPPINAFRAGRYSIRLIPQSGGSASVQFSFINGNRRPTRTLLNGQTISSSIATYLSDYDKFRVQLNEGQTLRIGPAGGGAWFDVCDSKGRGVGRIGNGTLIFLAPVTDTYYVIYYKRDASPHSFTSTVSITP